MRRGDKLKNIQRVNRLFESRMNESPSFGGQKVSKDQYDELQWDKGNIEKASAEAFKDPEGYSTNAQVGETYETKEGDKVKVLNIDDKGYHQVYLELGEESIAWNKRHGIPTPKPFKITWSGVQFTTIVGEIDDYDDSQYHGEIHGY